MEPLAVVYYTGWAVSIIGLAIFVYQSFDYDDHRSYSLAVAAVSLIPLVWPVALLILLLWLDKPDGGGPR